MDNLDYSENQQFLVGAEDDEISIIEHSVPDDGTGIIAHIDINDEILLNEMQKMEDRGRLDSGAKTAVYLNELPPANKALLEKLMFKYKMNADSPEVIVAALMGHIVAIGNTIPNSINKQTIESIESIRKTLSDYAFTTFDINNQIEVLKTEVDGVGKRFKNDLAEFETGFRENFKRDLIEVMHSHYESTDRMMELINKHRETLNGESIKQVDESKERLKQYEVELERRIKQTVGAALIDATEALKAISKASTKQLNKKNDYYITALLVIGGAIFGSIITQLLR